MRILGIETSCDETAVALLTYKDGRPAHRSLGEGGFCIEENLVASQISEHAKYGGVVPEVAARMHMEALFPMLVKAGVERDGEGIDAIAVTSGPGLVVALRVGVESAKTLAASWGKPLVSVNHLEGHIASAWLSNETPKLPMLTLMVSGGHTEIVLVKEFGEYEVLGRTRDDAAGEAFDKVAKLLGLGYPGGPLISKLAESGVRDAVAFPRPMLNQDNFDMSFSGLKTAVRNKIENYPKEDIAASFEEAVVDTLVEKMTRAAAQVKPASISLVGGVSANKRLREKLGERASELGLPFIVPESEFSTDNAVMIAVAGAFKFEKGEVTDPLNLVADPHLRL